MIMTPLNVFSCFSQARSKLREQQKKEVRIPLSVLILLLLHNQFCTTTNAIERADQINLQTDIFS